MKCKHAREIVNRLMDGELPSLASEAQAHVDQCPECREWQGSLERALLLAESWVEEPSPVDISAAVIARLPERHPASLRQVRVPVVRRVLAWTGVLWLTGTAALIGLAFLLTRSVGAETMNLAVVRAYQVMRPMSVALESIFTAVRSVAASLWNFTGDLGTAAGGFGHLALRFVLLDMLLILVIAGVWWSRRRFAGASQILAL